MKNFIIIILILLAACQDSTAPSKDLVCVKQIIHFTPSDSSFVYYSPIQGLNCVEK